MADNKQLIELTEEALIFYHVALLRGFRAAAAHLGLSKSVVSSKVSSLESRLGLKLLFRSTRDVSLTPQGEIYFSNSKAMFEASQKLRLSEGGFKAGLSGVFTISAPHDFMHIRLIPALKRFQGLHPKLRFNLVAADQVMNLEKEQVDLAIRVGADGAGHLFRTPFFSVDFGFFCHPSLAPYNKTEKEVLEWVQTEGAFLFRPGREKSFKLNGRPFEVCLHNNFQVHDVLSLKSLVLAGAGIGVLPLFSVKEEIAEQKLVQLLPGAEFKQVHYIFLSGVKRQEDARLNAVIEYLLQEAKNF
jgi:DNA-binding transcriptional LysR family regulator